MFMVVEPRRLYRQVADQIRSHIEAGQLAVGERLPAERDLAERFSVSRPTLREALIVLEVEGYIQIKVGSGIFVASNHRYNAATIDNQDEEGPLEVLRARCIIESAIAEEAARAVDQASLALLDANLKQMADVLHNPEQAIFFDRSFHIIVGGMAKNGPINRLTALIYDQRKAPIFKKLASYFESPHSWRKALDEHFKIRDAIAAKDPARAREAMREHLMLAAKRFSESFEDEPNGNYQDRRTQQIVGTN